MCINSELDLMAASFDIIILFTLSFIIHMQLAYIGHSMIPFWCQMSSFWQIRRAVDSIMLLQYHVPKIREQILK